MPEHHASNLFPSCMLSSFSASSMAKVVKRKKPALLDILYYRQYVLGGLKQSYRVKARLSAVLPFLLKVVLDSRSNP